MRYLIYGAGTIGITYGFMLSKYNEVDFLVKQKYVETFKNGIKICIKDLKNKDIDYKENTFFPNCVTEINKEYDGILVAVNRFQLEDVLKVLSEKQEYTKYFAFMQNNWNIKDEINKYIEKDKYIIAFPSSVGGGRDDKGVNVILFDEATRLGGECKFGIDDLQKSLNNLGIKTKFDNNIFDWLKVHYLQQSITAGAVLKNGSFENFSNDYNEVKKLVKAFREGIKVCKIQGVNTNKTFPAMFFKLPMFIIAHIMQKMFVEKNTVEMVNNHMKKGLPEWVVGYKEVLADGIKNGLSMSVWRSYDDAVEIYLNENRVR